MDIPALELNSFPTELEQIYRWSRQQLNQLFCSYFNCSVPTVTRDISDIRDLVQSGAIHPNDCPITPIGKKNFWLEVDAVKFIWYYRQVASHYRNRTTAKEYIKNNGIPL